MSVKNIEFINSYGRGFNNDSMFVKEYLSNCIDDINFKFFSSSESGCKNPLVKKGLKSGRVAFCKDISNAICTDASLPKKLKPNAENSNRILLLSPYDYLFKLAVMVRKRKRIKLKKSFINFTHIFPGSKFGMQLLNKVYMTNGKIYENVSLPHAWSLGDKLKQDQLREMLEYYFPAAKGKKIISIITTNSTLENKKKNLSIDLKSVLDEIKDNYFLISNNQDIFEEASKLSYEYSDCFGFSHGIMPAQDLLHFSDYLITNIGRYAATFATKSNNIFCIRYDNNYFEQYMMLEFPEMYLKSIDATVINNCVYSGRKNEEFISLFANQSQKNPCEIISQIIK